LNQCTPRKRSGRSTLSASPAIGSDEVLVAMMPSVAFDARPRMSAFSSGILGHRLDHEVRAVDGRLHSGRRADGLGDAAAHRAAAQHRNRLHAGVVPLSSGSHPPR